MKENQLNFDLKNLHKSCCSCWTTAEKILKWQTETHLSKLYQSPKCRGNWKTLLKKCKKKLRLTPYDFDHLYQKLNFFQIDWKLIVGPLATRIRCLMLTKVNFKAQIWKKISSTLIWKICTKAAAAAEPLQKQILKWQTETHLSKLYQSPKCRGNWKTLLKKCKKKLRLTPYDFDHFYQKLNFFQMDWKLIVGPLAIRIRCLMLTKVNFKAQIWKKISSILIWKICTKAAAAAEPLQKKFSNGKLRLT